MKSLLSQLIVVVLAVLGVPMANAQIQTAASPDALLATLLATPGDIDRGKTAFASCEICHRKNASGRPNGSIPRLSSQHASVIIKQVLDIRAGTRNNPSMRPYVVDPSFTLTSLIDISAYLKALPLIGNISKGSGAELVRGKQLYERDCATCHGSGGEGDATKFVPMVAAQHYSYLKREVVAIRDGSRGNSNVEMVKVVKPYTPAEIDAVADYMSQMMPINR